MILRVSRGKRWVLSRHKLFIASYVLLVTILIALLTLTYNIERRYTFRGDTLRVTRVTSTRLNHLLIHDGTIGNGRFSRQCSHRDKNG